MKNFLLSALAFMLASACLAQAESPATTAALMSAFKELPVEVTVQQRSTQTVPGSGGAVEITIDDITANQVITSLSHKKEGVLIERGSMTPTGSKTFKLHGAVYRLKLLRLHNALIGDDLAVFEVDLQKPEGASNSACVDEIKATPVVDPSLDTPFFHASTYSWPWPIVEKEDGSLEDTLGGHPARGSIKKLEHTAACVSTHQGAHDMSFCDAVLTDGVLRLRIHGGLPAYASALEIRVDPKSFDCAFEAVYPAPQAGLRWRITKKTLKIKEEGWKPGTRFLAWVSVEFEEGVVNDGKEVWKPHKIEGWLKPVVTL